MKRLCASILALALLSALCGCGEAEKTESRLSELRMTLTQAETIGFTARVSADLGETEFSCTLDCEKSGEELVMTVTEPELIAGVTARLKGEETILSFDGVELSLGLENETVSPIGAIPLLLDALLSGHIMEVWTEPGEEEELVAAKVYLNDEGYILLWFEKENLSPRHGELVMGEQTVVQCDISNFTAA